MIKISKWSTLELHVGSSLDDDSELEITITDENEEDVSIWITKEEAELLCQHLQNIL